jgi:AbiU2
MASRTPDEMLRDYTAAMGPKLGPVFHRLYNDNAWLHMKWNEFVKLFATSPAQIRDLNTAAPGFFHQVQELWWNDLLLHIFRMTDRRRDVLSVYTLLREAPASLKPLIESHLAVIRPVTEFARHARHNTIAHRNLDVALGVTLLTGGSRNDVRAALKAIDTLLDAVEHHFLTTNPTQYEFVDNIGGVNSLLDIVERGLKSRDEQFGYRRSAHPPDPTD